MVIDKTKLLVLPLVILSITAGFFVPQIISAIQTGLPDATTTDDGGWVENGCSAGNLHLCLDEVTVDDDTTYLIASETENDNFEVEFPPFTDPAVGTGHEVHIWQRADTGNSGQNERLDVFLTEAGTNRCTFANVVMTRSASYTETTLTCTELEADAITDYSALRVDVTVDRQGAGESMRITKIEIQLPDASVGDPNDDFGSNSGCCIFVIGGLDKEIIFSNVLD